MVPHCARMVDIPMQAMLSMTVALAMLMWSASLRVSFYQQDFRAIWVPLLRSTSEGLGWVLRTMVDTTRLVCKKQPRL